MQAFNVRLPQGKTTKNETKKQQVRFERGGEHINIYSVYLEVQAVNVRLPQNGPDTKMLIKNKDFRSCVMVLLTNENLEHIRQQCLATVVDGTKRKADHPPVEKGVYWHKGHKGFVVKMPASSDGKKFRTLKNADDAREELLRSSSSSQSP